MAGGAGAGGGGDGSGSYGGRDGGLGAEAAGIVHLNAGQVLDVVVGGQGLTGDFDSLYGGGGFVYSAVPEPSTWALMLAGFAGLGLTGARAARKRVGVAA